MVLDVDHRRVFESSPDVVLVLLPDAPRFTMIAATKARFEATHTAADTLGKGLFEVFPDNPDDPEADGVGNLRASLERVLATRAADTMPTQRYDIRGPDGTFLSKYWSPKNLPVLSASGEVLYILHRVEDVTELVLANELRARREREIEERSRELAVLNDSLRLANARLGELDAAKTAFFSNVSHEFRTPLTLMLGPLADLLEERGGLGAAQRARIELAHDNALRLLKLVNALLDFSRLEAGRLRARHAPLDLSRATRKLAAMFHSAFDKAGVVLTLDLPPLGSPAWVDREMWEKIVLNLISNALKFTLAGSVTVRLREDGDAFALEVADTGVGIPESELPFVFDRFHRVEGSGGRTHEGTGIGLALVRELTELHGGSVSVTSTPGVGTTFRVVVPAGHAHLPPERVSMEPEDVAVSRDAAAHAIEAEHWIPGSGDAAPPGDRPSARGAGGGTVLVVDDNPDLREYTAGLLRRHYDVVVAEDGLAALDLLRGGLPDVVVSDVMMPRLDGVGLVRAIRADPTMRSLPVILASARAGEEASVVGLDAGADDYVLKPFSGRELLARVRTHVELARARNAFRTELERANHELEAFSYSVSHDLRAPLRAIDGFARILVEDYGPSLAREAQEHLARIRDAAGEMGSLIEALLQLARIDRAHLEVRPVDLGALAHEIVATLTREHPSRDVQVVVDDGLIAHADRALLRVVLVNLLDNAWKYTARRRQARIHVGRLETGERPFFVRDDGAGFEAASADRLFAPFQRLHAPSEFEGTGVGLATVARVVRRHRGRIWAEAEVDRGATFFFTLSA